MLNSKWCSSHGISAFTILTPVCLYQFAVFWIVLVKSSSLIILQPSRIYWDVVSSRRVYSKLGFKLIRLTFSKYLTPHTHGRGQLFNRCSLPLQLQHVRRRWAAGRAAQVDPVFQWCHRNHFRNSVFQLQHGPAGGPHTEPAAGVAGAVQKYLEQ